MTTIVIECPIDGPEEWELTNIFRWKESSGGGLSIANNGKAYTLEQKRIRLSDGLDVWGEIEVVDRDYY